MLTEQDVKELAWMARIYIPNEKLNDCTVHLNEKMIVLEKILNLNPKTEKKTATPSKLNTVLRKDVVKPGLTHEKAMKNAPDVYEGSFRVPKII